MKLSIIIPVLNEAAEITHSLQALQSLRARKHELIVVDGGSTDDTVHQARQLVDQVVTSVRGRARQMNAGAEIATGDVLLFLHADTQLPDNADEIIENALRQTTLNWGRFNVRLSGERFIFRVVEKMMNWRSRITGIATGDQALFVRRSSFDRAGGFPNIALMEDIALSKKLRKWSRPICLTQSVVTSSRRWEVFGVTKTILLMWRLRLAYFFGADPALLARKYYSNAR